MNISYKVTNGPVANPNPTGSPFANGDPAGADKGDGSRGFEGYSLPTVGGKFCNIHVY